LAGGQAAADQFMGKVREHLASLGSAIKEPKTVPVMVKAFANLSGLAQACAREKKVKSVGDIAQFWIGFTRRYALVDFVDVGSGKEEADNKIRGNLPSTVPCTLRFFLLKIAQKFLVSISVTFNVSIYCSPVAMTQGMFRSSDSMLRSQRTLSALPCFQQDLFHQTSVLWDSELRLFLNPYSV
jgi:hypothetical protein